MEKLKKNADIIYVNYEFFLINESIFILRAHI